MKNEDVYLVATNKNLFRAGIPAKIIKVVMVTQGNELSPRLCYQVRFSDGKKDWVPISDWGNSYKIITFSEILTNLKNKAYEIK